MEQQLILGLALAALLLGTLVAVGRPGLYRLGQDGTPRASSGVVFRGAGRQGRWVPAAPRRDWGRFQGRGPGGVK
jgi:hypothetical protein